MPAQGAWGFWYIPGSKSFHVAWTGVVEFLAGFWLAIGAISKLAFGISISDAFQLGSGLLITIHFIEILIWISDHCFCSITSEVRDYFF
jgi:hypothetical protein